MPTPQKAFLRNISLQFLVDENLPYGIVDYLSSQNHDVLDVVASPLRGSSGKVLWAIAAKEKRIIVTRDLDFPLRGLKPHPGGVILLRVPPNFTASQITEIFKKTFTKMKSEDFAGNVAVITPGKIRIRHLP